MTITFSVNAINNYWYNKAMSVQELEKLKQISNVIQQSVQTEKIYLFGSFAYGTPMADSDFLKRQQVASLERKIPRD